MHDDILYILRILKRLDRIGLILRIMQIMRKVRVNDVLGHAKLDQQHIILIEKQFV
jgi:hypothetical protein